jgi:toxin-antitoxin system PIN domain toxin
MTERDLPDLNVWLALTDPDHQHHPRARRYWETESAPVLAFCRICTLGLLRLLTHSGVMRGRPFTPAEAWLAYRSFRSLPEVEFLLEPPRAESQFAAWCDSATFPAQRWTDAWLAAIAATTGSRIVSFDTDFHAFPGLGFLHLKPTPADVP